jgi:hypothetical protein
MKLAIERVDTSYKEAINEIATTMYDCYEERDYRHFLEIMQSDLLREIALIKEERELEKTL